MTTLDPKLIALRFSPGAPAGACTAVTAISIPSSLSPRQASAASARATIGDTTKVAAGLWRSD